MMVITCNHLLSEGILKVACKVNYLISVNLKAGMETHDDVVGEDPCWRLHSATTLV